MGCCSGDNKCSHHIQALELIKSIGPEHLALVGSCCNVRGLLGAAPRVTVIGTDVNKLVSMADVSDQDRVQLVATASPAASLSSDPADVIYLCENVPSVSDHYLSELAQIARPGGCLLFSIRYHQGSLPPGYPGDDQPESGKGYSDWAGRLIQAGFSQVEVLDHQILIISIQTDGELEFSVSDGLIKAVKGGAI